MPATLNARSARPAALIGALLVPLVLPLTGCAPAGSPANPTRAAVPTPRATPTVEPVTFTMPTECASVLPKAQQDAFAAQGLVLLAGPGGKYGQDYFAGPTPEEQQGGMTCVWGVDGEQDAGQQKSVQLGIAPLTDATHDAVAKQLAGLGLNPSVEDGVDYFAVLGDDSEVGAQLNALRPASWISVLVFPGGEDAYAEGQRLEEEAFRTVYR